MRFSRILAGVIVVGLALFVGPTQVAAGDTDNDGYDDATEVYLGTDPLSDCGIDAWPPDFDSSQTVDFFDILALRPPVFGTTVPPASSRLDLNADGLISVPDLAQLAPPMFGSSCPNPYHRGPVTGLTNEIAIDMDTTGNAARTVGAIEICGEVAVTSTIEIDVVLPAPGVDAADGIEAFEFFLNYDQNVVNVTAEDQNFLLVESGGVLAGELSDSLPDTDGSWRSGALDGAGLPEPAGTAEIGPGVLTRITLTGVGTGTTALTLTGVYLIAGSNAEMPVTTVSNATVSVDEVCVPTAPTPTPTPPPALPTVSAGHDLLETDSSASFLDFGTPSVTAIPADFFSPGSDPFQDTVNLQGVPIDTFGGFGDLSPTDTIVERLQDAGPNYPATIAIEIVALSLKSAAPITVTYNGQDPEDWDVQVGLASGIQSTGTMTIDHEFSDGGTFDSTLFVSPRLVFTRQSDLHTVELDWTVEEYAPIEYQANGVPWCHTANPLTDPPWVLSAGRAHEVIEVSGLTTNFFPSITCQPDPDVRVKQFYTSQDGLDAQHALRSAEIPPQPAIFSVRANDITAAAPIPCEASALLTLPTLTGSACSRSPLAPDRYAEAAFLGLDLGGPFTDDLDAISLTELSALPDPAFHFSVSDASVGVDCGAPPDVFSEASPLNPEARGDIFTDLNVSGCNALFQGEVVQGLNAPLSPLDDLDALTEPPIAVGPCDGPSASLIPCPPFSVGTGSAVLGAMSPEAWPADLLVPPNTPAIPPSLPATCAGPQPCVAVTALDLGLDGAGAGTDDLDALCWFDLNENGLPDLPLAVGGPDQYYFSLTPDSATLDATDFSAADILVNLPSGVFVAVLAERLGLDSGDDLDALKCLDPDSDGDGFRDAEDECPFTPTVWFAPPGDDDCDGWSTDDEGTIGTDPNVACDDGLGLPDWPPDFDDTKLINIIDVLRLKPVFNQSCTP